MLIPLKQGLKLNVQNHDIHQRIGLNVDSIKTRIETSNSESKLSSATLSEC